MIRIIFGLMEKPNLHFLMILKKDLNQLIGTIKLFLMEMITLR